MNERSQILPFTILAGGLVLSVCIFSWVWSNARSADQTISVTGSAKQDIVSDLGILRGTISVQASTPEASFRALSAQKPVLLQYLASKGFPSDKVKLYPVTNSQNIEYDQNGREIGVRGYVYSQRVEITSRDVSVIENISLDIASVVEKGVYFTVDPPEYYYTKLADVKIRIQAAAAKDAEVRAKFIAEATGRSLGSLRGARMGVLQITPKNSNQIADYGINDVSSIEKEITAVVNASFQIR